LELAVSESFDEILKDFATLERILPKKFSSKNKVINQSKNLTNRNWLMKLQIIYPILGHWMTWKLKPLKMNTNFVQFVSPIKRIWH
jgi:hypothetical protein